MFKTIVALSILSVVLSREFRCPDPDTETCTVINRVDYLNRRPKCRGTGCPPCWEERDGRWECTDMEGLRCYGRYTVDITDLKEECRRAKRNYMIDSNPPGKVVDLTFLEDRNGRK